MPALAAAALACLAAGCVEEPAVLRTWQELGPFDPFMPGVITLTGAPQPNQGRITALAIDPRCGQPAAGCRLWVGAAGGGVWRTADALADEVAWEPASDGLASLAVGSLMLDPTDPEHDTLYLGTGEQNGARDCQAGVGLYRSRDRGDTWQLVEGSVGVAAGRGLGAVAIDPRDGDTIYLGTSIAFHGATATGGAEEPPGAPPLGLYRSTDGGATFSLLFQHGTPPAGVNAIVLDPRDPSTVYAALLPNGEETPSPGGLWRSSPRLDGDATFRQVFSPPVDAASSPSIDRTELSLTIKDGKTRIYLGNAHADGGFATETAGELWRTDDADVPARQLFDGQSNVGWTKLSSETNGTPGFGTYGYCAGQCRYDNFVVADPADPDGVWLGGQIQSGEALLQPSSGTPRSNGRTVLYSSDAGVSVVDMSADAGTPRPNGMHADQHAIAFQPGSSAVAFVGSDGGLVRIEAGRSDGSAACRQAGLTGPDLADCLAWLARIPTRIRYLNRGLRTLQLYDLVLDPRDPAGDFLAGARDNGAWSWGGEPLWQQTTRGDGGQVAIDSVDPDVRMTTAFGVSVLVNFHRADPARWDTISGPLQASKEANSNFLPLIADPRIGGTFFTGLERVWRTRNSGGDRERLDRDCSVVQGASGDGCGDWVALGPTLTSPDFGDRAGGYVVEMARAPSDLETLWAATLTGRIFVSRNATAEAAEVTFGRIDGPSSPARFVSGIAVDPRDAGRAWVSFAGYAASSPPVAGHLFEVRLRPGLPATFTDLSYDLGDRPLSDVVYDSATGDLYVSSDWGVRRLPAGMRRWVPAAPGLPPVAVYGLALSAEARLLYAASHGRGAWRLELPAAAR